MGDSGHVPVKEDEGHQIRLEEILEGFRLLPPGSRLQLERDRLCGGSQRTAGDSLSDPFLRADPSRHQAAFSHPGVDLVVHRDGEMITVRSRKGILRFRKGGPWTDPYGTSWTFSGNPGVLDLQVDPAKKRVGFRAYPDAFRQLLGAAGAQRSPCLLVTARTGYEFRYGTSPGHPGGGSHGSLKRREGRAPDRGRHGRSGPPTAASST